MSSVSLCSSLQVVAVRRPSQPYTAKLQLNLTSSAGYETKYALGNLQSICTTPFSSVGKSSGVGNSVSSSAGEMLAGLPMNID